MLHDLENLKIVNTLVLGYRIVYMPNHPYANKSGGWVYEHRLIMENKIGRYLNQEEVVHHINHNRSDNRIENLELTTQSKHTINHKTKLVAVICQQCKKSFQPWTNDQKFCSPTCSSKSQIKIKWPSMIEIAIMMETMPMTKIGKLLGVSDNAVRKHIKRCQSAHSLTEKQ